jgi:hypothetical protein
MMTNFVITLVMLKLEYLIIFKVCVVFIPCVVFIAVSLRNVRIFVVHLDNRRMKIGELLGK